jgi:hypothetical protein
MVKTGLLRFLTLALLGTAFCSYDALEAQAQRTRPRAAAQDGLAVVRGRVVYKKNAPFKVKFSEMEVMLRPQVKLPPVPVPKDFAEKSAGEKRKWIEAYEKTPAGKRLIAQRKKLVEEAEVFDVVLEKNGQFVVYDVPPGTYGIQGRLDRDFKGTKYAFEVFGEIQVKKNVDEIPLAPILLEVTPLLENGQAAPPIAVKTYNNKAELNLGTFKGKYLFVNFWSTENKDLQVQRNVQAMYAALKEKQPIKLLSICLDEKRKAAVKFIVEQKLKEGSHGFTDGWEHPTVDAYGVRSIPSFWLINPAGEVVMTQYDFGRAFAAGKPDLAQIVIDRIEGKDIPTPAKK